MKVYVYPSDMWACGHFRLLWPGRFCEGIEVEVVVPGDRSMFGGFVDQQGRMRKVIVPQDAEAVVIQRPTFTMISQAVPLIREQGIAVIIDMDDDLARIHPRNPAFAAMHPKSNTAHSWLAAQQACRDATLVTCSTDQLVKRYALHGRGRVLHNYVPKHFLEVPHHDNERIVWPGSLHSHPDDLSVLGPSIWNLVRDGAEFQVVGSGIGVDEALGLHGRSVPAVGTVEFDYWPVEVAKGGVSVAPLADTSFNAAKSWLKPLESMACGVPVVMSPRQEYALLQRESGAGLLAEKPKQWEGCLRKLLRDERFRIEQSEAGRAAVKERFILEDQAWRWAEAWSWAIEHEKRVRRTP